jgi:hypothetical protein
MNTRYAGLVVALCLSCGLFGCGSSGPRPIAIQGEVSYGGEPVEKGEIALIPTAGHQGPATGGDIVKGKYHIPATVGPLTGGTYRVNIMALAKLGKLVPDPFNPSGPQIALEENYIPPQYNQKSTLVIEIPADARSLSKDFKLEKPPG